MMVIFFIGIGLSSILTALAKSPIQIGIGIFCIGLFASIYHPVGLALVVQGRDRAGVPLAINGIFGNMGVACAALITGFFIDLAGWRSAFIWPGLISIATGMIYAGFLHLDKGKGFEDVRKAGEVEKINDNGALNSRLLIRVFIIIFVSTAIGGLLFQSTTFALPKILDERLSELELSATLIGSYAFLVFAVAAFGQLIVGYLVDRFSIRWVFVCVAALQAIFLAVMPGLTGWNALVVATAFMLVVFGQIPINDVLISRTTRSQWRSRVYAFRYIITFSVMASSLPLIALIYARWGFDSLFYVLSVAATCIFLSVSLLPRALSRKDLQ
jgi:MFS family permease